MMYYLHRLSDQFIGFNVFLYVTFRAIAAAVTAFLVTLVFGNFIIRKLTALKLGQPKARQQWGACSSSERSLYRA